MVVFYLREHSQIGVLPDTSQNTEHVSRKNLDFTIGTGGSVEHYVELTFTHASCQNRARWTEYAAID